MPQKGPALSEPKGFAHILAVLFILGGIATGVYLVQSRGNLFTQFLPKAGEAGVFIVNSSGSDIEETESPNLSLKLIAPWPVVNEDDKSTLDPTEESTNSGQKIKQQKIKGSFVFPKGIKFKNLKDKPKILTTCSKGEVFYNKDGNKFSFKVDKGSAFCIKAGSVPGYEVIASSSREDPKPSSYLGQIAGVNCQSKKASCSEEQKLLDLPSDSAYVFQYFPVSEPPPPFAVSAIVAENPNFTINVLQIPIVSNPQTIDYILSDSNPGTKLVYVKFIDSNGEEQIFKDVVTLVPPPSPSPTPTPTPTSTPVPSPTPSPSASTTPVPTNFVKLTFPNGGETFNVGDIVRITWDSAGKNAYYLGWTTGPGSFNPITSGTISGTNYYDWVVNVGNLLPGTSRQIKIDILAYPQNGNHTDQLDNFFTVSFLSSKEI